MTRYLALVAALAPALVGVVSTAQPASKQPEVRLLRTPEGGLQPQVIADAKGVWHLIYLKGDPAACDVFYAVRRLGQTNFGASMRVNTRSGSAVALGTIRGAQMALGRNGRVHVAWNGSTKTKATGNQSAPMLYTRLNDVGDAFEPERNLMTASTGLDGGGSVAADGKGNVIVVWHGLPVGGPEGEVNRAVFVAQSRDDGRTFAPERQVSPKGNGACSCCGLKAFVDKDGQPGILYRAAKGGVERDVVLLMSRDGGNTFTNRIVGPWHATTCPMSSMDLSQGPGGMWQAAWETSGKIQTGIISPLSGSCDFEAPEGNGKRKHPVVMVSGGDSGDPYRLIAWVGDSGWGKGGSLAWECSDLKTGRKTTGRAAGVPAWSRIAAVADADGGFTIIY